MEATITIRRGKKVLFRGKVRPPRDGYEGWGGEEKFHEDLFNIERYINEQGAYRCHIDIPNPGNEE